MKTMLSFGLMLAAAGTLFACGEDGEPRGRGQGGTGNQTGGGGTNATNGGSGGGTTNGGSTSGGSGGGGTTVNTGDAFVIGEDGTVVDSAGTTTINGLAAAIASALNPAAVLTPAAGELCFVGETAQVVATPTSNGGPDYTAYWGAGVYVDLKLAANPNAAGDAGAADAGDAGSAEPNDAPVPWDPADYNVIGFSFVLEGKDPAMSDTGVPAEMRLQTRPFAAPEDTSACFTLPAANKHNAVQNVLFSQMTFECYNPATAVPLFGDPPLHGNTLRNIGFQVNANTAIAYQFNFCVKDIKPILGN